MKNDTGVVDNEFAHTHTKRVGGKKKGQVSWTKKKLGRARQGRQLQAQESQLGERSELALPK